MSSLLFAAGAGGTFALLYWLERRRPLRGRVEDGLEHTARNLAMVAATVVTTSVVERVVLAPVQRRLARREWGIARMLPLRPGVRTIVAVLLLDYTLWWWHWLNHKVPQLWRFHLVHHVDRDLDASTGLRFHFGEMALSVLFRALQLTLTGANEREHAIWQRLLIASVLFHHSNLRLPLSVDRKLARLVVTPRMHGIHHSDWREETDSNWSSLFSIWDVLHGTMRSDPPQNRIRIGVPAWHSDEDVRLRRVLMIPFGEQRDDWRTPDGELRISRDGRIAESRDEDRTGTHALP